MFWNCMVIANQNLIWGMVWFKNWRNLEISCLCSKSIIIISEEYSWQMKWRASKALSRSECSVDSNNWHTLGTISGRLANFPILKEIVLMREKAVSLMTGDWSSKAERHSRFRDSTNTAGKRWKWVLMLLSRMQPLWTRLFSSVKINKHIMMIYIYNLLFKRNVWEAFSPMFVSFVSTKTRCRWKFGLSWGLLLNFPRFYKTLSKLKHYYMGL